MYVCMYVCMCIYIYIFMTGIYICIYLFTHGYISMGASENEESPQMAGEIGKLGVACHYATFDQWHIRVA